MKKIILFLSIILIAGSGFSQGIVSHKPMGRLCYNYLTKRIEGPKSDKRRMKKGVRIVQRKHVSSNQLYKLSLIFSDDEYRLGFVKGAYPSITDKSNAIIVVDGFDKFSHQTILWEFIQTENERYGVNLADISSFQDYIDMRDRKKDRQYDKNKEKDKDTNIEGDEDVEDVVKASVELNNNMDTVDIVLEEEDKQLEESIDGIMFPDAQSYLGKKNGCESYLSDKQFEAFANTVAQFDDDKEKAIICMEYTDKYCFTTSQVMMLGVIIEDEASRYVFFKTAYEKVYDTDNFHYVKQLLSDKFVIDGLD